MNRQKFSPEKYTQQHFPEQTTETHKLIKNIKNLYAIALFGASLSTCGNYSHGKTPHNINENKKNGYTKEITNHHISSIKNPASSIYHTKNKTNTEQENWKNFAEELSILSENQYFKDFFHALIQQESKWNAHAKSHSGAIGLAQITSIIFEDAGINARKDIYLDRLIKILEKNPNIYNSLPQTLRKELQKIHKEVNNEDWERIRILLKKYKSDPYVNLLLGAITLDINLEVHTTTHGSELFFNNFITRLRKAGVKTEEILKIYPDHPLEKRLTEAISRYNGNKSKHSFSNDQYLQKGKSTKLEERDIHTIAVLENYQNLKRDLLSIAQIMQNPNK